MDDSNKFQAVFGSSGGSGGGGGGANDKVKVNSGDSTADYLENKLIGDYTTKVGVDTTNPSYVVVIQSVISRYDSLGATKNYSSGDTSTLGGFGQVGVYGSENSAIGVNVFSLATSLTQSVGIGNDIAPTLVTAQQLTAVGSKALGSLANAGDEQVAIGKEALTSNTGNIGGATTGDFNVALGTDSLALLNGGYRNTALGHNSGGAITTGARNTLVGYEVGLSSLTNITTGNDNILMGYETDSDGDENLIVGNNSSSQLGVAVANQNTIIGHNSSANASLQVIIGYNGDITNGGQDVLIGVNNSIDGSAFPTFATLNTHVGSSGIITGFYNQSVGYNHTITGDDNNAIGNFHTITGNDNILIGNSLTIANTQAYVIGVDTSSMVDYAFQLSFNNGSQFDDVRLVSQASSVGGQKSWIRVKSDLEIDAINGVNVSQGNLQVAKQMWSNQGTTLNVVANAVTFDGDNGNSQKIDLASATGGVTLTFSNLRAGGTYFIPVIQKASSPVNITTYTSSGGVVKFPNGTAPTISTGASAIDTLVIYCDGTDLLVNFSQNYS